MKVRLTVVFSEADRKRVARLYGHPVYEYQLALFAQTAVQEKLAKLLLAEPISQCETDGYVEG